MRFTQAGLADVLGSSCVPVDRVLQRLRTTGLAQLSGRSLTIIDLPGPEVAAGFDPAYLRWA